MDNNRVKRASRRFERLLGLYPAEYRKQFGDEMAQVFRTMYRAKLSNNESIMEFWVQTYIDIGVNAMAQSIKTKSTSDDTISRVITQLSKLTNWLVILALWAVLAGTLDMMVARPLYNLLPPWTIGGAAPLTLDAFSLLINTIFGLCLMPLVIMTGRKLREKLLYVLLGAAAFAVAPSVISDLTYYSSGDSFIRTMGSILLRDGLVVAAVLVLAKIFVLVRRRQFKWANTRRLLKPYVLPGAVVIGLAIMERATNYHSIATASKIDFVRILAHHEVQIALLLAVTVFVLMAFGTMKKFAAYFILCALVTLSGINAFSVQASHNDYCQQLMTTMMITQGAKAINDKAEKGYIGSVRSQLNDNCHMPYDITSQFVSTPDTAR